MALTVFETAEQLQPCEQGAGDAGKVAAAAAATVAEKVAVILTKETDLDDDDRPDRDDVWNAIQGVTMPKPKPPGAAPRQAWRSSTQLTQKSLEICTESLGSETGSDGFSDATDRSCPGSDDDDDEGADEVAGRARVPPPCRAFPPPLPSLARRRAVGALEMRQHRGDGRLVVQAVPVPSPTLFRAHRRGGRLLLSFADTASSDNVNRGEVVEPEQQHAYEEEDEDDDEEEEVEVVDRGTVVEFKVSTQPQARSGTSGPRVHRSALVINKFVGAEPAPADITDDDVPASALQHPPSRRSTTTAIAALAAASALSATAAPPGNDDDDDVPGATFGENKLLMTAKRRRSKEELLKHMRRCGQLSGKLFFWEPRIATSSS